MHENSSDAVFASYEWLDLPTAAEQLGVSSGRLHRLIEDHFLLAAKHDGAMGIPALFIRDGEPLAGLRGTLTLLEDHGVTGREAMIWLLSEDDFIGATPIETLVAGHKSTVRKAVQLFID
ncbi:Rv2175c family DNA-binding protein [Gulosibacter bifidus]|uniref:Rv2175c family DNA-binding protein n=1 Tax=Gulosibacter bifidus TaxID=272239 RepID=A0ABW5RFC0_9MICO|nr:Rv2175c family DNA-binding protein [Gulosibacter bifidus]